MDAFVAIVQVLSAAARWTPSGLGPDAEQRGDDVKLYSQAQFQCDPSVVAEVFASEAFLLRLRDVTQITQTVLDRREEGNLVIERINNVSSKELPGMMASALGSKTLTYVQVNRLDPTTHRLEWRVELPVMSDKVRIAGVTTAVASAGGCVRTVDGECTVKVPFVGGRIEKVIVGEFMKSYERATEIARSLIRERLA
ncbi:MAG: hypothetical protein ACI8PZ_004999 [Myxococcota bacterium]